MAEEALVHDGVSIGALEGAAPLPALMTARERGIDLSRWAVLHRARVEESLREAGGVLFRGFDVGTAGDFRSFVHALYPRPLAYVYRSTPRTAVGEDLYTATEYPPEATIPLHCENAYQHDWPTRIAFYCPLPAKAGGETPIASTRRVTARIDPAIVELFARRKVRYVRNYHKGVDLPWQTVFQTEDRAVVDAYCAEHGIEREWLPSGSLRTRQVCQGVASHPVTGETLWFNQAHLFHVSSLDAATHVAMRALFAEADLPRNATFGDGEPIAEDVLAAVRSAFDAERVAFKWRAGDVMLLDNMLAAHGRAPFRGPRKVLVAMAEAFSEQAAAPAT